MRVAITGHRELPVETARLVESRLRAEIGGYRAAELVGVTCLADGADSIFARLVLAHGGRLSVIIPASEYRAGQPEPHHATFDALCAKASEIIELDFVAPEPPAYLAAGLRMLDTADHLIAVWDGRPARGPGGTADIVAAAHDRGLSVTVVWPPGAQRA
ncbi:hypothetical protein [Saccharopolyspora phatthalungensis]|uniref:Uncharacterized protein n=1 Tax=Saccharopolyspora phatthalungensis TaxID=664693 RepID=A0A840QDX5_9PSEU|nr:hypothetical protein [Saccharopolyspora phatthalungensis]MBB5156769.1 hypothetical protein [Saccharopolyspora phatthalungensis]